MLILMRYVGERILIGHDVIVEVIQVDRGQVKLKFSAPMVYPIRRGELPPRDRWAGEHAQPGEIGHLVVKRKSRQEMVIGAGSGDVSGGGVHVEVCRVLADRVWLGITAPPSVRVDREEMRGKRGANAECGMMSDDVQGDPLRN